MFKINQKGFSILQAMVGISLISAGSLYLMRTSQQQNKVIKQQSGDISINYVFHNISKAMAARSICTHSLNLSEPSGTLKENLKINSISMKMPAGENYHIAQVETDENAKRTGKFGAYISGMEIKDFKPALGTPSLGGLRKAKLVIEFKRMVDQNYIKTDYAAMELNVAEKADKTFESCFGDEDFKAKAFCETSLRGTFDNATSLCRSIKISSKETEEDDLHGIYSLRTVRENNLRSDIRIEGRAEMSKWYDEDGAEKWITFDNGVISDIKKLFVKDQIVTSRVVAKRFNHSSDRRLKEDIRRLTGQEVDNVLNVQGVSFNWKDSGEEAYGFIAQDIEKIYPHLVSTDATTGIKSVDYSGLIPVLVEKMKQQNQEIQKLDKKLDLLKSKKLNR